ncbi:hypothetical protein AB0M43_11435 [Longispora sp. NPDC051575]|uniref:hypothetical protein n=1 Tax=Longispora sp. NPDC051575 TaxID=3154943 RepID=UPI00342FCB4E
MKALLGYFWAAVRPVNTQQRFLFRCGTLLVASGLLHLVIAAVDDAAWWGPVSWRKPAVFGLSFGLLLWAAAWVVRQLPVNRWGWIPVGILGGTSVLEVVLISMQRWRGMPSHFSPEPTFDNIVWGVMAQSVFLAAGSLATLLIWAMIRFRGSPASRVAVIAGLAAIMVAGKIGGDMAALGELTVTATGDVPRTAVVFGAAGSAKLAHALGLHGLHVLGLLAIGLDLGGLATRAKVWFMLLAVAGYGAVFGSVMATAYAGRAWTSPAPGQALLAAAGLAALLLVAFSLVRSWSRGRDDGAERAVGAHRAGVVG